MKQNRKWRFLLCALLCAVMLLSACGNGTGESQSSAPAASGYIETDVSLPKLYGCSLGSFSVREDGSILLCALDAAGLPVAYTAPSDTGSFQQVDGAAVQNLIQSGEAAVSACTVTPDGTWWLACAGADESTVLVKMPEGGEVQTIPLPLPTQTETPPQVLGILQGAGNTIGILFTSAEKSSLLLLNGTDGKQIATIQPSSGVMAAFMRDGKVYVTDYDNKLHTYSAENGQEEAAQAIPTKSSPDLTKYACTIGADGAYYYADATGIYSTALGGDKVLEIVAEPVYIYALDSFTHRKLVATDDAFWLAGMDKGTLKIYRYAFGEQPASGGDETTLTIWAMDELPILRETMQIFQKENPGCRVTVEYGHEAAGTGETDEDIIRELNTRLIAGQAPDVLIVDGLPVGGLAQNGLLSDLAGLINPQNYYDNIVECFAKDGAAYAYPAFYRVSVFAAAIDDTPATDTLEALAALCMQKEDLYFNSSEDLFNTLYAAYAPRMFPNSTEGNEQEIREFLQQTKAIVDSLGLTAEPEWRYGEPAGAAASFSQSLFAFSVDKPYGAGTLNEFMDIAMLFSTKGEIGVAPLPGNSFIPYCSIAIPKDAQNRAGAERFAKLLLGDDRIQGSIYNGGFSVLKGKDIDVYKAFLEDARQDENYVAKAYADGFDVDAFATSLTNMSDTDLVLKAKLLEQAKLLYSGAQSLDASVSGTLQNTRLYFEERRCRG